jgi:integrase
MTLTEYLPIYLGERDLRPEYIKSLRNVVMCLDTFMERTPLEEITAHHLNRWSEAMEVTQVGKATGRTVAKRTIHNKLILAMTLLRAAVESGLRGPIIGRIKKIRVRGEPVRAFSIEDVGRLLQAASEVEGWFERTGIRRCDWWVAVIHAAWDTALRIGDLLDLEWPDFREHDGAVVLVKTQSKTGQVIAARLRDDTWAAIQQIRHQGETGRVSVFPWAGWRNKFSAAFRSVAQRAGLSGTPKYLRRARATAEYRINGAVAAGMVLGHSDGTGALAWRNYVDRGQLTASMDLPPALPPIVSRGCPTNVAPPPPGSAAASSQRRRRKARSLDTGNGHAKPPALASAASPAASTVPTSPANGQHQVAVVRSTSEPDALAADEWTSWV